MKRSVRKTKSPRRKAARGSRKRGVYAVVGLGYIAQAAVLPAFAHARNSELVALVSDDPVKLDKLGRKYRIERRVHYDQYDGLLRSGEIDAVFIALPNSMHADFTIRAAQAGVHVLCEKPMATTSSECLAMIDAADKGDVKLMIGYRLHFEAGNLDAIGVVRSGRLGEPRIFTSEFTMQVDDDENIRLEAELGGGPIWDIGIYCINAARYLFRSEPSEVFAMLERNAEGRFSEVEEMATASLRFPDDRLASFTCSFGASDASSYRVIGTRGSLRVEPAYGHAVEVTHHMTLRGRTRHKTYPKRDQFAPELVHFSDCIRSDRTPATSGSEGLNDVRIIETLYESARLGRPLALSLDEPDQRPGPREEIRRPPVAKQPLVHAASPREDR
jgi:glucose-fructose oxidoreductase